MLRTVVLILATFLIFSEMVMAGGSRPRRSAPPAGSPDLSLCIDEPDEFPVSYSNWRQDNIALRFCDRNNRLTTRGQVEDLPRDIYVQYIVDEGRLGGETEEGEYTETASVVPMTRLGENLYVLEFNLDARPIAPDRGTVTFFVTVDPNSEVRETNENNNTLLLEFITTGDAQGFNWYGYWRRPPPIH